MVDLTYYLGRVVSFAINYIILKKTDIIIGFFEIFL